MRKILIALLGVLLVAALAGAGTFAYFSDTETSTGNTFTAGTLDLKVDDKDHPNVFAVNIEPMKPGDTDGNTWNVTNSGSIPGDLKLTVSSITDAENSNPESETNTEDPGDLSGALMVILYVDADNSNSFTTGDTELYGNGSGGKALLSGMPGNYDPGDPGTKGGNPVRIRLDWELPASTGNEVQGDKASFNIEFRLNQA